MLNEVVIDRGMKPQLCNLQARTGAGNREPAAAGAPARRCWRLLLAGCDAGAQVDLALAPPPALLPL